eukprot:m.479132 g.479132  ORF g.479132 m.479132 type:complete len:67 (+) comp21697_c0_seq1:1966-2166(+)
MATVPGNIFHDLCVCGRRQHHPNAHGLRTQLLTATQRRPIAGDSSYGVFRECRGLHHCSAFHMHLY